MDSDVLTRIHRSVSRISVALESHSQISDSLRLSVFISSAVFEENNAVLS